MLLHLSKLTTTLRQLSEPEMAKLEAYLNSPYFETPSGALTLFQYLKKLHPHFDEKKTAATYIEKKVPALGNQKKQANYGSDLLKATEHFLALEDFQSSADTLNRHRLQAYKKHHLFDQFNKEHESLIKELNNNPEQDIDVFYEKHMLTELALNGFDTKLNRTINNDIHPVTETLDVFYAIKKLRYHCEILNRQRVLGTDYKEENIEYILQVLEPFNTDKYPYVYLFVNAYKMRKADSYKKALPYYENIKNHILNHSDKIPANSLIAEIIEYIVSGCLDWNNKGFLAAGVDAFWAMELKIKHNLLLHNGKLQPAQFRNTISLAIQNQKDHLWIKSFIDKYSPCLPKEYFEINHSFAQAQYFFHVKNYTQAMPLFQQALAKDEPIFNAIVRRWQFMCMYEQDSTNTDLLFDFLTAYEKYILRYSDSFHQFKEIFTKNILYCKKLLKATDIKLRSELAKMLHSENYFTGKEWLLKQL